MPLPVTFTVNTVPVPPTQTLLDPVGLVVKIGAAVTVNNPETELVAVLQEPALVVTVQ